MLAPCGLIFSPFCSPSFYVFSSGMSGGVSITNGTALIPDSEKGTIVWDLSDAGEDFSFVVEAFLWVDSEGHVSTVSHDEGLNLTENS